MKLSSLAGVLISTVAVASTAACSHPVPSGAGDTSSAQTGGVNVGDAFHGSGTISSSFGGNGGQAQITPPLPTNFRRLLFTRPTTPSHFDVLGYVGSTNSGFASMLDFVASRRPNIVSQAQEEAQVEYTIDGRVIAVATSGTNTRPIVDATSFVGAGPDTYRMVYEAGTSTLSFPAVERAAAISFAVSGDRARELLDAVSNELTESGRTVGAIDADLQFSIVKAADGSLTQTATISAAALSVAADSLGAGDSNQNYNATHFDAAAANATGFPAQFCNTGFAIQAPVNGDSLELGVAPVDAHSRQVLEAAVASNGSVSGTIYSLAVREASICALFLADN
jgi:hypothetical protein